MKKKTLNILIENKYNQSLNDSFFAYMIKEYVQII